ncbi:MAG: hypothetical protein ACE15E_06255 [Acidobacteriota bacterium]
MQQVLQKAGRFLLAAQNSEGGWGYSARSGQSAPEPSCYSLLALHDRSQRSSQKGIAWLESQVAADGGVRLEADDETHWSTSLVVFTLTRLDPGFRRLPVSVFRLLAMKGSRDAAVGWAWNEETYSWVEPTCYAMLALKAAGLGKHARVADAERMLESRTCIGGGWNQGLRVSFLREMKALPSQTALVMLALQDRADSHPTIADAGRFLRSKVEKEPSTLTLALAILAFDALGEDCAGLALRLERRQAEDGSWREAVHLTALALLALRAVKEGWNAFKL